MDLKSSKVWKIGAVLVAIAIFAVMDSSIRDTDGWHEEGKGGAEDFSTLATKLFEDHVLALEVLGILLTAAMIGAMVIARPLGSRLDSENYPTRLGRGDVAGLQGLSDVDRNLRAEAFATTPLTTPAFDIMEQAGVSTWPEPEPSSGGEEE